MSDFTHFNAQGFGHMVDVSEKESTLRVARAYGEILMGAETLKKVSDKDLKKGDVLSVAQIAGIMGAKQTSTLIPMCHNILIDGVDLEFEIDETNQKIKVVSTVKTRGKTGIEMEALTAVSVAMLTVYDMCKAVDKDMVIGNIKLIEKMGGKSGHYIRKE